MDLLNKKRALGLILFWFSDSYTLYHVGCMCVCIGICSKCLFNFPSVADAKATKGLNPKELSNTISHRNAKGQMRT